MRTLFDLGHPAHFHLFKNVITALRDAGHEVQILARQKDCLLDLLDNAGWPYQLVQRRGRGLAALSMEACEAFARVISLVLRHPVDLMVGSSIVIGPASRLTGATSVVFCEDDAAVVPLFAKSAYPSAHYIVTPRSLEHEAYGPKHLTYPGYHELAYLHPRLYKPDPSVRKLLGVKRGEKYFLLRLVALEAHHDIGQRGLSIVQVRELMRRLQPHGRIFISAEGDVPGELHQHLVPAPPHRMLDVVSFAEMIIGDSQTMAIEAAVMGTPSLRCNTFVGRLSVLEELEHRYGLTVGVRPERFGQLLGRLDSWLSEPQLKAEWERKRQAMLAECIDLTGWTLDLLNHLSRRRAVRRSYRRSRKPLLTGGPTLSESGRTDESTKWDEPLQEKYATRNPVSRLLIGRFLRRLDEQLIQSDGKLLDVGTGEGDVYLFLSPRITRQGVVAVEIDSDCFERMGRIVPELESVEGSIYHIPFDDDAFNTVLCSEVLEHLEDPDAGLRELLRVARQRIIVTVPREPMWRIMNMLRGAYWRSLGNTPGHIQHWTRRGFLRWVGQHAEIKTVRSSLPWTLVVAEPRRPKA